MTNSLNNSDSISHSNPEQVRKARKFLTTVVSSACDFNASDIHIRVGSGVMIRLDGQIRKVKGLPAMTDETIEGLMYPLMSDYHLSLFRKHGQTDLSLSDNNENRVRVNVFRYLGQIGVVMRVIEKNIPKPSDLGLPKQVSDIVNYNQGLVIFSGATGSGKSTSIASLLNEINIERYLHILTIEDPVEFVFEQQRCVISQREIGIDVPDFTRAMRSALREDPDIIFMGEMRDSESIQVALNAAETGHLVFSTLHAPTSSDAITRMVSNFAGLEQETIRSKLAHNLRAVVTQRLLPKESGAGRALACEVFSMTAYARDLVTDPGRIKEIKDLIKSGDKVEGMLHLDEHLAELVHEKVISEETALANATSRTDLALKLQGF